MKIEDLIELLNNRLNSFKLSKDYAVMSGDLERANSAETEISGIMDTLYKLNLLVDASKTAIETDTNIADVVSDKSVGIVNGYDISSYATDPLHEKKIKEILSYMPQMNSVQDMDEYIAKKSENSPVTGIMILSSANTYAVDARLMMAIMEQDSHFGTRGLAVKTLNPGNVGNNDDGDTRTYSSWQDGVTAVAKWLSTHRKVETGPSLILENTTIPEIVSDPEPEVVEEIVEEEEIIEDEVIEEPVIEEEVAEDPNVEEGDVEEPTTEEEIPEEPVSEEPVVSEEIPEEPVSEEPVVSEEIPIEPIPLEPAEVLPETIIDPDPLTLINPVGVLKNKIKKIIT